VNPKERRTKKTLISVSLREECFLEINQIVAIVSGIHINALRMKTVGLYAPKTVNGRQSEMIFIDKVIAELKGLSLHSLIPIWNNSSFISPVLIPGFEILIDSITIAR
jgi:hypothetical protein